MTELSLNVRSMLSYLLCAKAMVGRRCSRILVALCISVFAHLAVLLVFSQSGVGIIPGYRGDLQIYLPAARSQGAQAADSVSDLLPPQSEKSAPSPLQKAQPLVANDPTLRRRTEPSPVTPQMASPTVAPNPTTAVTVRQDVPGTPQIRAESGGGAASGGQLKRVSIDFDVLSGPEKRLVSRGRHVYVAEREFFGISVSDVPLDGQVSKDSWRIEISGRVSLQGLSPILYETRGALPRDLMALSDSSVDKHAPNQALQKKWQIADGLLDRQSLLYHFMFKPPELTGGNVWLSDGSSHALYTYRMGGTEALPIAGMGNVSTLKLVFTTSASQERIELWLLPDRHYLPLKARYTDGQGAITEQTATSIDYE